MENFLEQCAIELLKLPLKWANMTVLQNVSFSFYWLTEESMLDLYLATQSNLLFVGDLLALIRRKFMSADAPHRLKLAEQILEYAPIQNLPFIQRLLKSHPDRNISNQIGIQETMEVLAELPASADLIAYSRNAGFDLGVSESFSNSQVGNLLPDREYFC